MVEVVDPIELHTPHELEFDDEKFFQFCQANDALQIERAANGDIIIMSPEAASSGHGSFKLIHHFGNWEEDHPIGKFFGSSAGFILPNGAMRSPDIAWITNERLQTISDRDWNRFLPLCPDFVLELRSPSDRLRRLQEKMAEYIANGARLGWLLDPVEKDVHIYRPNVAPEILNRPTEVSADPVLPGFRLPVEKVWAAIERRR